MVHPVKYFEFNNILKSETVIILNHLTNAVRFFFFAKNDLVLYLYSQGVLKTCCTNQF